MTLDNGGIAELLMLESDGASGHSQRALRSAARRAFLWPEEAAGIVAAGRPLTELSGVGPRIARRIALWIAEERDPPTPPEVRTGFRTRAGALAMIAEQPDALASLRGDLQMHTTWSDGGDGVRDMAAAGAARGYEYISITDHSKGLKIAGGMTEDEFAEQGAEIDALNDEGSLPIRVLRSIELNLSLQGEGDMDPASLVSLDIVLGSFHSALRTTDDQTGRYLAALRNPHLHVLGHPRCRMYDRRAGLRADWERVFVEAAEQNKAVEIDSFPDRQDLDVELAIIARDAGCRVSIGTDSHAKHQLFFVEFGIATAIAAGLPRERILNCLPLPELLRWAKER